MIKWVYGDTLAPSVQRECLARFTYRHTGEHKPTWAKDPPDFPGLYKPVYVTDAHWLRCTEFAVTKDGRLDNRVRRCMSGSPL